MAPNQIGGKQSFEVGVDTELLLAGASAGEAAMRGAQ